MRGESSHWANRNLKFNGKFGWNNEYFAVSVSQSHLNIVSKYIDSQELYHQRKTFQQEYNEFISNYHFTR